MEFSHALNDCARPSGGMAVRSRQMIGSGSVYPLVFSFIGGEPSYARSRVSLPNWLADPDARHSTKTLSTLLESASMKA